MRKKSLILTFATLLILSSSLNAMTHSKETRKKYLELKSALETEKIFEELANDAAKRSHLSKAIGFGSIGIGISAPLTFVNMSLMTLILPSSSEVVAMFTMIENTAVVIAAVGGSEIKAVSEAIKIFKKENPESLDIAENLENEINDRLNPELAMKNIIEAKRVIQEQFESVYENELDGSVLHNIQDRITFGSLSAKATRKLHNLMVLKRMLIEREIKIIEASSK